MWNSVVPIGTGNSVSTCSIFRPSKIKKNCLVSPPTLEVSPPNFTFINFLINDFYNAMLGPAYMSSGKFAHNIVFCIVSVILDGFNTFPSEYCRLQLV